MHTTYILKYMTKSYQLHEAVTICGLTACSVIKDLSKQFREGGEVAESGNAEKVILGAKTPYPWCTTTVKGFTKNHALVTHQHSTIGRDKMDICDQEVISRSSDPADQSLIQQQRKYLLFFLLFKKYCLYNPEGSKFNLFLISLQGLYNVGRGSGSVAFSSFQISNRYIKKKTICANLTTFTTFHFTNT